MKRAAVLTTAALAIALGASASQASAPKPIVFAADRAPTVAGEVYSVGPSGRRVDLSRSPYEEGGAVVSSDGKRVAFVRYRGDFARIFEVGVNGRGLVAAAPPQVWYPALQWQPGGNLVAAEAYRGVALDEPGHEPIHIHKVSFALGDYPDSPSSWSPDGNVLLCWQGRHELRAVSPDGRTLWTHRATPSESGDTGGGWSPGGLVAIIEGRGVVVYDESGQFRFRFQMAWTPSVFAWSPDGNSLAAVSASNSSYTLQVRTASGSLVLQRRVPSDSMGWADNSTVVVDSESAHHPAIGVDIHTGTASRASTRWLYPLSTDRTMAIIWRGSTLGVAPTAGGPRTNYRRFPPCDGYEEIPSTHFAGRSIVYESFCDPFNHLYSLGRHIHRLTDGRAQETEPALSRDGTQIAYVWNDEIRIANAASGAPIRTLTHSQWPTTDGSPSWSPDGQSILFAEAIFREGVELWTVPAAGGTPTDLHVAGTDPAWGPTKIAYKGFYPSGGIWTANPDGSNPTKVSRTGHGPTWSATGTLAYLFGNSTVVVGATRIHLPFAEVDSLAWSPDGSRFVVVARKENGLPDVYTVKTDGTNPLRLTKYYDASSASAG